MSIVAQGDRSNFSSPDAIMALVNGKFNVGEQGRMTISLANNVAAAAATIVSKLGDRPNVQVMQNGNDVVINFTYANSSANAIPILIAAVLPFIISIAVAAIGAIGLALLLKWVIEKIEVAVGKVLDTLKNNPVLVIGLVGGMLVLALALSESGSSVKRNMPTVVINEGPNAGWRGYGY